MGLPALLELDLRVLSTHWTEAGARDIFAELVNQCVASVYGNCRAIRPSQGDGGIDTFIGEFDNGIHIWQAKFFPWGVGDDQKGQIRKSWKSCVESTEYSKPVRWTLCIPIEMSLEEAKWWQTWKKKNEKDHQITIELWSRTEFVRFSFRPDLTNVFHHALKIGGNNHSTEKDALNAMRAARQITLKDLPSGDAFSNAVFVRKLEKAGITQHKISRTAFYNFELFRQKTVLDNEAEKLAQLEDLQLKIFGLWESNYNAHEQDNKLGGSLYVAVDQSISKEEHNQLFTPLPLHILHKKGGLHYWADICEIGWTADFKTVATEDPE